MRLDAPWLLAVVLPLGWVVWWSARRGARTVPRRQHRWAVALRLIAVTALALALTQPILTRPVDDRTVLFLLDRSDSIGAEGRARQEEIVGQALDSARPMDRMGVAVFGVELRLDSSLVQGRTQVDVSTDVDGSATDLGGALRAAASLLPTEGSRRIVVLTDLAQTTATARQAARDLAEMGIAVDVIALEQTRSADALVESVSMSPTVRRGDRVPVDIVVRSNQTGPATLSVTAGDGEPIERTVRLESGVNRFQVEVGADRTGPMPVVVTLDAGFDTRDENDTGEGLTRVLGPARVAVVEGEPGDADQVGRAIAAAGIDVDTMSAIPSAEALLAYDGVVLVNVDEPAKQAAADLASYVEDLGRGLVVIGGDHAYGLGDYADTPLESVLPVSSNPDDLIRRQPVAEVLVIDTSGSMAACHCNGGGMQGGVNKTDISRAGAGLAIDALAASDQVGVLTFSSGYDWVLPLGPKPGQATVDDALARMAPSGDTEIAPALQEALDRLAGVGDSLRHIVLFTDGWDPNEANLLPLTRRIADEGITLSVLATGEGPGTTLQRMADIGGGRFYPGGDLQAVPEIFAEETLTVSRNLATEGSFYPVLGAPSPVTADLTSSPPLLGYVLTKDKASASVLLRIGQGDPLLATWQRGLGRATAWTSDATTRWSAGWVGWDRFVEFWGDVVRDVLPADRDTPPEVWVDGGELRVRLTSSGLADDSTAVARVRRPDGQVEALTLRRTGADSFEGATPVTSPGGYWVSVSVDSPDGSGFTTSSGAVSSYQEEFAFRPADPGLGAELASVTGGRLDPDPSSVFDPTARRGRAESAVWPWLVAGALAAFLGDVALRRLVLAEGDAAEWKTAMVTERRRQRRKVAEHRARKAETPDAVPEVVSDSETLQRLMRRKHR